MEIEEDVFTLDRWQDGFHLTFSSRRIGDAWMVMDLSKEIPTSRYTKYIKHPSELTNEEMTYAFNHCIGVMERFNRVEVRIKSLFE